MHQDVSSLVHTIIAVENGLAGLRTLPHDDVQARRDAIENLRERITEADGTPLAGENGERSKFFGETSLGMWG
ncbi:hypothetical protein ACFV5J_36195 [Streptomyces zaomyceticus]|uniref:hypothetical protein n=1 Tax=Streptomyces zaomyceticus TaxID=68286 RepID=UPI00365B0C52